jgi:hypothetical protein
VLCSPLADEIALHSVFAKVVDLNVHLLTLALEWVFRDAWFLLGRVWPCVAVCGCVGRNCGSLPARRGGADIRRRHHTVRRFETCVTAVQHVRRLMRPVCSVSALTNAAGHTMSRTVKHSQAQSGTDDHSAA